MPEYSATMVQSTWHLVSGEYPPTPGGVGDYTRLVAHGLARDGAAVHVWTGGTEGVEDEGGGVSVHRVAGGFSAGDLERTGRELDAFPGPRRLVVQYVPHAYGRRAMNVGFCRWLSRRNRAGDDVWTMFHEVLVKFLWRDSPRHWLLSAVTRWMAGEVLQASSRAFVTIPAWEHVLAGLGPDTPIVWLPVPSTIPTIDDPVAVNSIRGRIAPEGQAVVGTFGTYSSWIRDRLRVAFFRLLEGRPDRVALILGRGGDEFATDLIGQRPELAGRVIGPGMLEATVASLHLQVCDVLVQPYPDGVSARRTSVMAGLAHGRPVVSTEGHLTEPFWGESGAIRLAPVGDPESLTGLVELILADPSERSRLGHNARELYERRFALERTIDHMLCEAATAPLSGIRNAET